MLARSMFCAVPGRGFMIITMLHCTAGQLYAMSNPVTRDGQSSDYMDKWDKVSAFQYLCGTRKPADSNLWFHPISRHYSLSSSLVSFLSFTLYPLPFSFEPLLSHLIVLHLHHLHINIFSSLRHSAYHFTRSSTTSHVYHVSSCLLRYSFLVNWKFLHINAPLILRHNSSRSINQSEYT
jgi:hypothetical protein